jgi:hypothetical protein
MPSPAIMMPVWPVARNVGADGQQPAPGALHSRSNRNTRRRRTHIEQPAVVLVGRRLQTRQARQSHMHARHEIQSRLQCLEERAMPARRNVAARVRDADHHAASTASRRGPGIELRQAQRDSRAGQRVFTDATIAGPIAQAERRLRETGFDDVAEEQQMWMREHELSVESPPGGGVHQNSAVTVTP